MMMESSSTENNMLTCNFKDCYKEISKIGFVTDCSHIFCQDHGKSIQTDSRLMCPACKKLFTNSSEIFQVKLDMPKISQKLMLAGQNPRTIIEIAKNGLSFWEYQKRAESNNLKRKIEHYRKKLQDVQKQLIETTKNKDAKLEAMELEIQKINKEKQELNLELVGRSDELLRMGQKYKKLKPTFS